jgi:hypothetical protein
LRQHRQHRLRDQSTIQSCPKLNPSRWLLTRLTVLTVFVGSVLSRMPLSIIRIPSRPSRQSRCRVWDEYLRAAQPPCECAGLGGKARKPLLQVK